MVRNILKIHFFLLIIYFVRFSFNDNGVLVWNYTVYSCKVKVKDRRKQIKLIVDVTWRRRRRRRVLWVWVSTFSLSFSPSYGAMKAIWCRSNLFLFWQNCLFTFMIFCFRKIKLLIIICITFCIFLIYPSINFPCILGHWANCNFDLLLVIEVEKYYN